MKSERKIAITFSPEFVTKLVDDDEKKVNRRKKIAQSQAQSPSLPPSRSPPAALRPRFHALPPPFLQRPLAPASGEEDEEQQKEESRLDLGLDESYGELEKKDAPKEEASFFGDAPKEEASFFGDEARKDVAEKQEEIPLQDFLEEEHKLEVKDVPEEHRKSDVDEETGSSVEVEPAPVARDLQPLMRVLERTEKHGEELQKRSVSELEEMKKRAQELERRHRSESPPRTAPCLTEKEECITCFANKDPVRCKAAADAYIKCTAEAFKSTVS